MFRFDYVIAVVMVALTLWPLYLAWVSRWKNALKRLDQMRRYEVGFGSPSEETQVSMQDGEFHRIEEEFEGLGFGGLGDYVIAGGTSDEVPMSEAPIASPFGSDVKQEFRFAHASVCRVLVNREHGCIASISAPLSSTPEENRTGLHFLITSAGNGWKYTSHADEPPPVDLEGSARDLASFEGPVTVSQLFKAHLERRADIARAGGFSWQGPLSLEQVIEWEGERYARIRVWAKDRSPFSLLRTERRGQRRTRRDFLGELEGKL